LILGIIFGTIAVGALISWFVTNVVSKKTKQGEYFDEDYLPKGFNVRGGTICPKCDEAYSYSVLSGNFLTHKLSRCPHCGKLAFTRPTPREKIIEEMRKLHGVKEVVQQEKPMTDEEILRKQLDESKFMD